MMWHCDFCDKAYPEEVEPWVLWQGYNGSRVELTACDRCHEEILEEEMEIGSDD